MFQYVVKHNNRYMQVKGGCIIWTRKEDANKYASKYAVKKHIRTLDIPAEYELEPCQS